MNFDEYAFYSIRERLKALEDKVFKKTKALETTRAQQILLLNHLGLLEKIRAIGLPIGKQAELLSVLLNRSPDNLEDDLRYIDIEDSPLNSKRNYEFLLKCFSDLKLEKERKACELIIEKIERKE